MTESCNITSRNRIRHIELNSDALKNIVSGKRNLKILVLVEYSEFKVVKWSSCHNENCWKLYKAAYES